MKRIAYKLYLDTNVYVFGRKLKKSNSRIILDLAKNGLVTVIISSILVREVKEVFSRLYGRKIGKYARFHVESLPNKQKVSTLDIADEKKKYASFVKDEDLDHLTAAKIGGADYFISTDSDFIESDAKEVVKVLTPKRFIELIGIKPYDTPHEE